MVRHILLWNTDPDDPDASGRILDALNRLKDEPVPAGSWTLGAELPPPGSGDSRGRWQYGLVCDDESREQPQAYYSTPEHAAVIAEIVPLTADRAVCDSEL